MLTLVGSQTIYLQKQKLFNIYKNIHKSHLQQVEVKSCTNVLIKEKHVDRYLFCIIATYKTLFLTNALRDHRWVWMGSNQTIAMLFITILNDFYLLESVLSRDQRSRDKQLFTLFFNTVTSSLLATISASNRFNFSVKSASWANEAAALDSADRSDCCSRLISWYNWLMSSSFWRQSVSMTDSRRISSSNLSSFNSW